ncbi:MAG: prepilin peptidase [Candidatus Levybacteria bacterium]|nr:prepilin peptidase [Candidatus Levybacteria bacterium]
MEYIIIFLLGLCVGSFLNVVADRITTKKSIFVGRSECSFCHKELIWFELIPLVSFLIQGRKCRNCHKELSWEYFLSELALGVLFIATYARFSMYSLYLLVAYFVISFSLAGIYLVDSKKRIIPIPFLCMILLSCIIIILDSPTLFIPNLLSGIGAGIFFFLIFALTKGRGMGFGDVLYSFVAGLLLGFPGTIFGLYFAFLTGAITSLILILGKKKRLRGDTVPFGPFLVIGTLIMVFFGHIISPFILSLLF